MAGKCQHQRETTPRSADGLRAIVHLLAKQAAMETLSNAETPSSSNHSDEDEHDGPNSATT
ncbi:MAG: hypothetical protein HN578_04095 [Rhodospirillales bacterium]|jgi:hypothetical protein|nr:hypothetical protein [Rhodospirillaceae bacterium]MBT7485834.1 hypothetical protein [Rhodospirillales bacterium]MBT8002083.1 hypothetical protein [Rhodospirillales bacterium]